MKNKKTVATLITALTISPLAYVAVSQTVEANADSATQNNPLAVQQQPTSSNTPNNLYYPEEVAEEKKQLDAEETKLAAEIKKVDPQLETVEKEISTLETQAATETSDYVTTEKKLRTNRQNRLRTATTNRRSLNVASENIQNRADNEILTKKARKYESTYAARDKAANRRNTMLRTRGNLEAKMRDIRMRKQQNAEKAKNIFTPYKPTNYETRNPLLKFNTENGDISRNPVNKNYTLPTTITLKEATCEPTQDDRAPHSALIQTKYLLDGGKYTISATTPTFEPVKYDVRGGKFLFKDVGVINAETFPYENKSTQLIFQPYNSTKTIPTAAPYSYTVDLKDFLTPQQMTDLKNECIKVGDKK